MVALSTPTEAQQSKRAATNTTGAATNTTDKAGTPGKQLCPPVSIAPYTNCSPEEIEVTVHGAVNSPGRYCVRREDCIEHVIDAYAGGRLPQSVTNTIEIDRVYSQADPQTKLVLEAHPSPPQPWQIRFGVERRYGISHSWEKIKWVPSLLRDHDVVFVASTK
jgi:hypothetical protein